MTSIISALCTVFMLLVLPQAPVQQQASPASFVGTWVGLQTWAVENPPPSAREPQPVTLTIEMIDGKLVGTMPFLGGLDLATFVETKIVGDELQASAIVVKPRPAQQGSAAPEPARKTWTDDMKIMFYLKADKTDLTGRADVLLGDLKWLAFKYSLGKKRLLY